MCMANLPIKESVLPISVGPVGHATVRHPSSGPIEAPGGCMLHPRGRRQPDLYVLLECAYRKFTVFNRPIRRHGAKGPFAGVAMGKGPGCCFDVRAGPWRIGPGPPDLHGIRDYTRSSLQPPHGPIWTKCGRAHISMAARWMGAYASF